MRTVVDEFFDLALQALKEEASELEGLRSGVWENDDFAFLRLKRTG